MQPGGIEYELGLVAAQFDEAIEATGAQIEALLPPEAMQLVDDLDAIHYRRAAALVSRTFEIALRAGIVIGRMEGAGFPEGS